jgi:DNA-binding transcriptional regulator GbsR (MarR family)
MKQESRARFIDAWGAMGAVWGINRSVARVHALLMASDGPVGLDEIAETLSISKGNVSMSLRELRAFGVVREAPSPGDRRDFYVSEPDAWTMFFRILAERKKRELDPALAAVRAALDDSDASGPAGGRLAQVADLLSSMESAARRLLENPTAGRTALKLLATVPRLSVRGKRAR